MDYVPIFKRGRARFHGGARAVEDQWLLHGRALRLESPGDGLTTIVRGRSAGVVVQRTPKSGIVEVRAGISRLTADLSFPQVTTGVIEIDLPGQAIPVPLSVRLTDHGRTPQEAAILGIYTSDIRTTELPSRMRERVDEEARQGSSLCQLTDVFKWYEPDWRAAMDALAACPPYEPPDFVHRKAWEWIQTVYGLDQFGMLSRDTRGLGVGVGWEPLSFFFSNHVGHVVATDLYPVDDQWSTRGAKEGNPQILEDPDKFAPYAYDRERVEFRRMDGRRLDFPDATFDFVWSCSSIEHFGGHTGSAEAMQEIERVLKPGGVASVITEFVLPEPRSDSLTPFDAEYFNARCVHDYLVASVPALRLVEPLDLTVPRYYVDRAVHLPEESAAPHGVDKPHIVLRTESGVLVTSILLFLRKSGGSRRPLTPKVSAR
jgi:SAM-dependent methyltransferase